MIYYLIYYLFIFYSLVYSSDVVELNSNNFDEYINGDKHVMVEFYAPWCGHCKNLAPIYEIVATTFKNEDNVVIAKVDADAEKDLGVRFGISGFPTLKFFPKGSTTSIDYQKGRTDDELISFLNEKAGTSHRAIKPKSFVQELNPQNFDSIALDSEKYVFVKFYAPWCGHCKQMAPDYEKIAKAFIAEENVIIAKVNADKYKDLASKYGVTGFPTLKYYGYGAHTGPEDYQESRDPSAIVQFINDKAGTHRLVDGSLKENTGRIEEIDVLISQTGEISQNVYDQTKDIVSSLEGQQIKHGDIYLKAMKKVLTKGDVYIEKEISRLENLINSESVNPKKKSIFMLRKNILKSFRSSD